MTRLSRTAGRPAPGARRSGRSRAKVYAEDDVKVTMTPNERQRCASA